MAAGDLTLVLIVLVVLLLPYLLHRCTASPSGLDPDGLALADRAPVSRQWLDFPAISPLLPRSVVASEDAKFCKPIAASTGTRCAMWWTTPEMAR